MKVCTVVAVGDCFCAVVDTTGDGTADSCDASSVKIATGILVPR